METLVCSKCGKEYKMQGAFEWHIKNCTGPKVKVLMKKICQREGCEIEFTPNKYNPHQKWCSPKCNHIFYARIRAQNTLRDKQTKHCLECDKPVPNTRTKYCSKKCYELYSIKQGLERHYKRVIQAKFKIADGGPVECAHCGCPHIEALTIGHFNHDGMEHRKEFGSTNQWVIRTSIEEVKKHVRLECIYCNGYQATNQEFPPPDRLPIWRNKE